MGHILIIDDDEKVCKAVSRYVKWMGDESSFALTLAEGMEFLDSNDWDVVLLDVNLPDGNGLDALPDIQKAITPGIVIIMSGEPDPGLPERALKHGAYAFIHKPLKMETLESHLRSVLESRNK